MWEIVRNAMWQQPQILANKRSESNNYNNNNEKIKKNDNLNK